MATFTLSQIQVLGSNTAILLAISAVYDWSTEGKRGERTGTAYHVLALGGSTPSVVAVKVPYPDPIVTQAVLDAKNRKEVFQHVTFDGFQARPYTDRGGRMALSCRAEAVRLESDEDVIDLEL